MRTMTDFFRNGGVDPNPPLEPIIDCGVLTVRFLITAQPRHVEAVGKGRSENLQEKRPPYLAFKR